ncbi:conserved hypothetical protein [uncultured delta proteobacterium]|uniref:DUF3383 domain-containing protein n=1 Tax=uncultured delta proteobacterium TaxID=34034 RepID=A0A212J7X7_9DELT|nr:conserved hypothetical protein [uncultured delta proteobacterium]
MANALSVDRVVRVTVNLQPKASARRNFGVLAIVSDDPAIDPLERIRTYTGITGITEDCGVYSNFYKSSALFFSQVPRPYILMLARHVKEPTPAYLKGGLVADADLDATAWKGITDGSFGIITNNTGITVSGLNFSTVTNMNGVASVISAKLAQDNLICKWTGEYFVVSTKGTGPTQELGYAASAGEGTDLSSRLALTVAKALPLITGRNAETPLECVANLADLSGDWYGLTFADEIDDDDHLEVGGFIEASSKSRIYGATITDSRVLSSTVTNDLASRSKALSRQRTFLQYSKNPHAVCSAFGRAFTVNFNANRSTLTLKFKQEPSIVAEGLTESQAATLEKKNCNVFVKYDNDTAILQEGVMSNGAFFDEVHGLDWLQNAIQNECWNLLYQSKTKIPQTEPGITQIVNTIAKVLNEGVNNGLIAPGVWNGDGFGDLERGDYLQTGWYIYAQSVDDQPQSEREQRKAPPIQVAVKLAGAVHSIDVQVDVNR